MGWTCCLNSEMPFPGPPTGLMNTRRWRGTTTASPSLTVRERGEGGEREEGGREGGEREGRGRGEGGGRERGRREGKREEGGREGEEKGGGGGGGMQTGTEREARERKTKENIWQQILYIAVCYHWETL